MTKCYTFLPVLLALFFQILSVLPAHSQRPEIKESGLQIGISTATFNSSFYAFECGYGVADWKDVLPADTCATLIWAASVDSLGCEPSSADWSGKIVLIKEGTCSVATKVLHAQQSGAVAVFILEHAGAETPPFSKMELSTEGELPPVRTPTFYIKTADAPGITTALASGEVVTACLKRPAVYINRVSFPPEEIQQYCYTPLNPFRFSLRLSNRSGQNLQNVQIEGKLLRLNGQEISIAVLDIPEINAAVTDSVYHLSDPFNAPIPPGPYEVLYTVEGELGGIPYFDTRKVRFNTSTYTLATELGAPQVAYRPDSISGDHWAVANLFYLAGNTWEPLYAPEVHLSVLRGAEMNAAEPLYVEVSLFRVLEDILPDFSNFQDDEFASESLEFLATGTTTMTPGQTQNIVQIPLLSLTTAEPDLLIYPGERYLLAAAFSDASKFAYAGFNEDNHAGEIKTLIFSNGRWQVNGLYGHPNAVLRLRVYNIDGFCDITDTEEAQPFNFNIFPNPAQNELHIQGISGESPNTVITFMDMTGRILLNDFLQGLVPETLTYPTQQFPNGAYIVRITSREGTCTKPFIIHKE